MRNEGRTRAEVLAELETRLGDDLTYASGRILGSMISAPHPFAEDVYRRYLEKNVGDPGLFPATAAIEEEAVGMLGSLLSHPGARGNVVSGGNEANLLALWAAREERASRGRRVIVPSTAHCSYDKAGRLLGLEIVHVGLDSAFRLDIDAVRAALDERTIALVGVAGSTDLGAVDPIEELSALALEHDLHLHVDAAFGGFVLPFLAELGLPAPAFDFALPGVSTITIDPHKMGLGVQPAGAILFRTASLQEHVRVEIPYLAGGRTTQTTVTGTRPGAAVLAVWAMMRHLGRAGYRDVVRRCLDLTRHLAARVREIDGVELAAEPILNIVGIRPTAVAVEVLGERLRRRGWALGQFPTHLRVVLLPHLSAREIEPFLADLARFARPGG
ncbi:MAG: tyrosine decarboxylase MfnA [Planctomycetota bacterium]